MKLQQPKVYSSLKEKQVCGILSPRLTGDLSPRHSLNFTVELLTKCTKLQHRSFKSLALASQRIVQQSLASSREASNNTPIGFLKTQIHLEPFENCGPNCLLWPDISLKLRCMFFLLSKPFPGGSLETWQNLSCISPPCCLSKFFPVPATPDALVQKKRRKRNNTAHKRRNISYPK